MSAPLRAFGVGIMLGVVTLLAVIAFVTSWVEHNRLVQMQRRVDRQDRVMGALVRATEAQSTVNAEVTRNQRTLSEVVVKMLGGNVRQLSSR